MPTSRSAWFQTLCIALAYLLLFDTMAMSALQYSPKSTGQPSRSEPERLEANSAATADAYVSGDDATCGGRAPCFSSIQSAIDAAGPGQHVYILPGQYEEQLVIEDKNDHAGAEESDRIVISPAPGEPLGSVVVGPRGDGCWNGHAAVIQRSSFVTVRGLVIRNAGRRGVRIRGLSRANRSIHFVQNVLYAAENPRCMGGVTISHLNEKTLIANNVIYGTRRDGVHVGDVGSGPQYIVSNTIVRNGHTGIYVNRAHEAVIANNIVHTSGTGKSLRRFGIRQGRLGPRSEKLRVLGNLVCGNARGELFKVDLGDDDYGNLTPTGTEGPGISSSPSCADPAAVFENLAGLDGRLDSDDDEFALAVGSPALDAGVSLPTEIPEVAALLLRADLTRNDVRPADGDGDGNFDYDIGAIEIGAPGPTPVPSASPTPDTTPTPTATASPSPTPFPTPAPTLSPSPTPTVAPTPVGTSNPPDLAEISDQDVLERQILAFPIPATDADLPADTLTWSLPQKPSGATIDKQKGSFVWVPSEDQVGTHPIRVRVTDASGAFDEESFEVAVRDRGGPPSLAEIDDQATTAGVALVVNVAATDPDLPSESLSFTLPLAPNGMTIDASTGEIAWAPGAPDVGEHDATVQVEDTAGLTDFTSFRVTVEPVNAPPIADDDAFVTRFSETLTVDAPGVLGNDVDPEGSPLAAHVIDPPLQGDLTFRPNGSFDYTPATLGSQVRENINLTLLAVPQLVASSTLGSRGSHPERVVDDDLLTTWFNEADDRCDAGDPVEDCAFFEQVFLRPVSVREIQYFRHTPGQAFLLLDFTTGIFELYDADDNLLFTTTDHGPDIDLLPSPIPDPPVAVVDVETLAGGPVENVSRVVFRATGYAGVQFHGFAELYVFGDGHIEALEAAEEWAWTAQTIAPGESPVFGQVLVAPTVGDLDGDGLPEVAFAEAGRERLYVVNGEDGSIAWFGENVRSGSSSPVLGDIDGDGKMEVIVPGSSSNQIHVFEDDGTLKTTLISSSDPDLGNGSLAVGEGNLAIADLDGDGLPEIIIPDSSGAGGGRVAAYHLVADELKLFAVSDYEGCGNNIYRSNCIPLVADVDLDGEPEIVAGSTIYGLPIEIRTPAGQPSSFTTRMFTTERTNPDFRGVNGVTYGWSGVGNFDEDAFPEIAMVAVEAPASNPLRGTVTLFEHDLSVKWGPIFLPDGGLGGPPTVADFDNDGMAEIGVASLSRYYVFDTDGSILWERAINDASSNRTGSTVFDFQNDGSAEVVYSDEGSLYVLRGLDGRILFDTHMGSITTVEYPIVADVDGDGQAEIVSPAQASRTDFSVSPPETRDPGLYVFGSANERWVAARPIWNQHTYHVTNVLSDGTIPREEQPNWLLPGLNNFRQNGFLLEETDRTDSFTYRANDGSLDSNDATVFLDLRPANTAPQITSSPRRTATVGFRYLHDVQATDLDFDPLEFALVEGPVGMTIDQATGLLDWSPATGDIGDHVISVIVTDDDGATGQQAFLLTVGEPVRAPDVRGLDQATANDRLDAATLTTGRVTEVKHPTVATGLIVDQSPPADSVVELGSEVHLTRSNGPAPDDLDDDGDGLSENQGDCDDDDLNVFPGAAEIAGNGVDENCDGFDRNEPIDHIVIEPSLPLNLLEGEITPLSAYAIFADQTAQLITGLVVWDSTTPAVAAVDSDGLVTAAGCAAPPSCTAVVSATLGGLSETTNVNVTARDASDVTPPVVEITSPADGATAFGPIDVIGSATDADLVRYELSIAPTDGGSFRVLATETTPVANGVLGQLDPTLLLNDLYRLRLQALDSGGTVRTDEILVQVAGHRKVGVFSHRFIDLQVPVSGIPIRIARVYDSRNKSEGDFGFAWRMEFETIDLTCTPGLGEGWAVARAGLAFSMAPVQEHRCSLRMFDGTVEEFDLLPTPLVSAFMPFSLASVRFVPRPGTLGTLENLGNDFITVLGAQPGDVLLLDDTTFQQYAPARLRYTSRDGTQFDFSVETGLERVADLNGNTLTIDPTGVTHSSGVTVAIERDGLGRITAVTDPAGSRQTYTYSASGDLVRHVDRESNATQYFYDQNHNLVRIDDPLGRTGLRVDYDAEGRVLAQTDGAGNRTVFDRDIDARTEVIRNRIGYSTTFEYDERGYVLAEVDHLLNRTERTYDTNGNVLTRKDPLGKITRFDWDTDQNLTKITDPLNRETRFTHDSAGRVVTVTNHAGETVTTTYDARGNLTSRRDADGHEVKLGYDADGNLERIADALGNVETFESNSAGLRASRTDARGSTEAYVRDALGNVLTDSHVFEGPDGPTPVQWTYGYDRRGLVESVTVPGVANAVTTDRDFTGGIIGSTDALGNRWDVQKDVLGNLTRRTTPGEPPLIAAYDAEGQSTGFTSPNGQTFSRTLDEIGRGTEDRAPATGPVTRVYDDASRLTLQTNSEGEATILRYDDAGQITEIERDGGSITRRTYDDAGRIETLTDPEGGVFHFTRNGNGEILTLQLPDLSQETVTYDANGNVRTRTTAEGLTWTYDRDELGTIVRASGPGGIETTYGYDSHSNLTSLTDARANTVVFAHDALDRVTRQARAGGEVASCEYDALARTTTCTDFNGIRTDFVYDDAARRTDRIAPEGTQRTFVDVEGRIERFEDARGTTTFAYDGLGRPTNWTGPRGTTVGSSYDSAGRLETVATTLGTTTLGYNDRGEINSITDPAGITSLTLDLNGRAESILLPNGFRREATLDAVGRPEQLTYRDAGGAILFDLTYVRDATRRISRVDEVRSDGSTQSVAYTYDVLGRLETEVVSAPGQPDQSTTYTYDLAGNLLERAASATTTFTYDDNDQIVSGGAWTYGWDGNGNLASRSDGTTTETFTYDSQDRLTRFVREATNPTSVDYAYDQDGLLAARTQGGTTTHLVWDRTGAALPRLLEERTDAGALRRRYVHVGLTPTHFIDGAGNLTALLTDQFGTVRGHATPTSTTDFDFDAFGRPEGPAPAGIAFTGGYRDAETGLVFLRSRWLSPELARFTQMDSGPRDLEDPRTLNRYSYSLNDPINNFDPTGQETLQNVMTAISVASILFAGVGVVDIVRRNPYEAVFSGFGLFNVLRNLFERKDAVFAPIGAGVGSSGASFEGGKRPVSIGLTAGIEVLDFFNLGRVATYFFFGSQASLGVGDKTPVVSGGTATPTRLRLSGVYNTPDPDSYTGWFISLSASAGVFNPPKWKGPVSVGVRSGVSGHVFWSPVPTYYTRPGASGLPQSQKCTGCESRYSHGARISASGAGKGVRASASLTWYWKLFEFFFS